MFTLVDYGMGNLFSVEQAFKRLNIAIHTTSSPEEVKKANVIILPGVGAFPDAVKELKARNLWNVIKDKVEAGTPIIGICVGMQLLFEYGEEIERTEGFGFLRGTIRRFSGVDRNGTNYKVPHMGWNTLTIHQDDSLLQFEGSYVYYVHSFYAAEMNHAECIASSEYGDVQIPGIVGKENIIGIQFHPEKSSDIGNDLLKIICKKIEKKELSL